MKYSRPIIVPDIEPFKTYIDKYHVGLTFEEGNSESFINAVEKASELGTSYFTKSILEFKKDFSYENWKDRFLSFLEPHVSN